VDDAQHERGNDAFDFAPPPGPTPRERRRRWAEQGDVEALLGEIRAKPWSGFPIDESFKHILTACEVRARSDPEGFGRQLFAEMVALNGFLLLRTQVFVIDRVVGRGPFACKPALGDLSADVAERLLPRLAEMQKALAEVLVAQAQTARLWALTRAKEAQAGQAAGAERRSSRRPGAPGGDDGRGGPEAADAKAGGSRDGMAPPPARGRRRG
jgi:hypothetical protein